MRIVSLTEIMDALSTKKHSELNAASPIDAVRQAFIDYSQAFIDYSQA
ncbi:hypothetical protein [Marinomonas sp. 2405UD68-3]